MLADVETDPVSLGEHIGRLSDADRGRNAWESGWQVRCLNGEGGVVVEKKGIVFDVAADLVRHDEPSPGPGSACRVSVPAEMRGEVAGSWCTRGETDLPAAGDADYLLRIYWHLTPSAAPRLVNSLTSGLDRLRVPFRLKLVSDPHYYRRADAGVLFLTPDAYRRARAIVRRTYLEIGSELRPEVPKLTKELAPGLAVSEGPRDGQSFGAHRCALLARGLVRAFEAGAKTRAARWKTIARELGDAGLDPKRPYLAPGSRSRYPRLRLSGKAPSTTPQRPRTDRSAAVPSLDPLARAAEIGDVLCRSAYRADGRCNWLGSLTVPGIDGGPPRQTLTALGNDLYGGISGVALFLAELYSATHEEEHREVAVAAQSQAFSSLRAEPERCPPYGFYEGWLGIACAAQRVASRTANEDLAQDSSDLLTALLASPSGHRGQDLLSGDAGTILGLLGLSEETGNLEFLEAATRIGGELLEALAHDSGRPRLTGLSHGAAGIGLALLELGVTAEAESMREAGRRMFDLEDALFDPERQNWPDLRIPQQPGFMAAWCHGAPGIALSRLRAIEIDPQHRARYETAARAGLSTTLARIEHDLDRPGTDNCLCHGLGGLLEIASYAAEVLDDSALLEHMKTARRAFVRKTGTQQSSDPSLLTGDAGVGYLLLRISEPPRFPTVLLPGLHRAVIGGRKEI